MGTLRLTSARGAALVLLALGVGMPGGLEAQQTLYYHVDAIGSVRAVTDSSGNVIERHDYLPFGEECTTGPCATNALCINNAMAEAKRGAGPSA